jgi:hypothetical protein
VATSSNKETLGHVNDAERIFSYRLLRIARGDQTPLAGFEQDDYVKTGDFGGRKLTDLLEEFASIRRATMPSCVRSTPRPGFAAASPAKTKSRPWPWPLSSRGPNATTL